MAHPLGGSDGMGEHEGVRVLVVDDDAASLEAARTMLGLSGFEVRGANNGAVGLEEILTFRPDVVIFDFWMPVADGRELLQGIREVGRRLGLVAMSGTPEVEDWCGRVGVTQFLRKPFERAELIDAVRLALDEARSSSVRSRIASSTPAAHRMRVDRAVMLVGPRESVAPIRNRLREGERPTTVACVEGVEDASRALASFQLDAVAILACDGDAMLPALIAEASVRGLPVILDRPSSAASTPAWPSGSSPRVHVAPACEADAVVALIQQVIAGPRGR